MLLCLCAAAWTSGCCHSHYSRCGDWDENCESDQPQKRSRSRRCRADKTCRNSGRNNCDDCCSDCCNSCCGESGMQPGQSTPPMTYDGGAAMGGGCASGNCGSTTMSNGTPMYSGNGNMPFPPGEGWTIQSTTSHPIGNEPHAVPASTPTPITPPSSASQGWSNPSSAPNPAPVPPPLSYNR